MIENYQNNCQLMLKTHINKRDETKCLRYGKTLLVFNSVAKYVNNCLIEKLFFFLNQSSELSVQFTSIESHIRETVLNRQHKKESESNEPQQQQQQITTNWPMYLNNIYLNSLISVNKQKMLDLMRSNLSNK